MLGGEDGDVAEYDGASSSVVMMGAVTGAMGRLMHHPRPSMLAEYEPEFGSDDTPSSQLEELPRELAELDLASVEVFSSGGAGMLGMRSEDQGGGFDAIGSDGRRRREEEGGRGRRSRGGGEEEHDNHPDYVDYYSGVDPIDPEDRPHGHFEPQKVANLRPIGAYELREGEVQTRINR